MKLSFHGAARSVTGSKHLLTLDDGTTILLDCGMFQGMGPKTLSLNEELGFDAAQISILLLSHAHIDHSGLIPMLVKKGFAGKIYCTPATKELTEILLSDSADIQFHETNFQNRIRELHQLEPYEPLYTPADVAASMALFETVPFNEKKAIADGVIIEFTNAGHLIGSAAIMITVTEQDKVTRIAFSGDVGKYRSVLLQPPAAFEQADYIILESTYGASTHAVGTGPVDPLLTWIKETCIKRKGKLIIPAFSVGRTQEVLYALNQLEIEHRLPELPYYVDSPLSKKATTVLKQHMEEFNEKLQKVLVTDDDPFDFRGLQYIETQEESKALAASREPCVIISASGTAEAGRVKHHIAATLHEDQHAILFVGYCQEDSMGGQLLRGKQSVEIYGEPYKVAAEIGALSSMSAHADSDDLVQYLRCQDAEQVKKIFLVHGEYETQQKFAERLARKGFSNVIIPELHESFIL